MNGLVTTSRSGVPVLPVAVLGAAVSPGINTCSLVNTRLINRKYSLLVGESELGTKARLREPIRRVVKPGSLQVAGLRSGLACSAKPVSGRVQLAQKLSSGVTTTIPPGSVAARPQVVLSRVELVKLSSISGEKPPTIRARLRIELWPILLLLLA